MFSIFEAMSIKFTIAYLKHKLTANNRHGTHSPFVYKLADEVIYDFSSKKVYEAIEAQQKKLLHDDSDFADLPKNKIKKTRLAQLIFRLAIYHSPKNVMLIGANLGLTTAYLAKACPKANLILIEEPELIANATNLDFVYLNGSSTKEAILNCFNCCLSKLNEHSLFIVDDNYRNEDIKTAWAEIKNHPQVTVTIDLFWLGLVYFKKGQAKEHFKLKF